MNKRRIAIVFVLAVFACTLSLIAVLNQDDAPAESAFVMQRYDIEDTVHSTGQSNYQFSGILGDKLVFSWGYYGKGHNIYMGFTGVGYEFTLDDAPFTLTDYDMELGNWIELSYWTEGT